MATKYEVGGTVAECEDRIAALLRIEVHTETNQGTYGASEACRKVGCGDPQFANREVYETVGGKRRETGPDEDDAPGRMRKIGYERLAELRAELTAWQAALKQARRRERD